MLCKGLFLVDFLTGPDDGVEEVVFEGAVVAFGGGDEAFPLLICIGDIFATGAVVVNDCGLGCEDDGEAGSVGAAAVFEVFEVHEVAFIE